MRRTKRSDAVVIGVILIALLSVAAFYWEEARKEVVFLCGNFNKGVGKPMVLRQLDTGNFLRYQPVKVPGGDSIEVDSMLNLGVYKCIIDFDSDGNVINAVTR